MCAKRKTDPYRIEKEEVKKNIRKPPVQNLEDYLDERIAKQSDRDPVEVMPRIGGTPPGTRQKCTRQVYTTMEVAEIALGRLQQLNIRGNIERCPFCGFLHIEELR